MLKDDSEKVSVAISLGVRLTYLLELQTESSLIWVRCSRYVGSNLSTFASNSVVTTCDWLDSIEFGTIWFSERIWCGVSGIVSFYIAIY